MRNGIIYDGIITRFVRLANNQYADYAGYDDYIELFSINEITFVTFRPIRIRRLNDYRFIIMIALPSTSRIVFRFGNNFPEIYARGFACIGPIAHAITCGRLAWPTINDDLLTMHNVYSNHVAP